MAPMVPIATTRTFSPEQVSFLKNLAPRYAIAQEEKRAEAYLKNIYGIYFDRFPMSAKEPLYDFRLTILRGVRQFYPFWLLSRLTRRSGSKF